MFVGRRGWGGGGGGRRGLTKTREAARPPPPPPHPLRIRMASSHINHSYPNAYGETLAVSQFL